MLNTAWFAVHLGEVGLAAVVEPRRHADVERERPADPADHPDQAPAIGGDARLVDRHEVGDLGDTALGQVASHQDRGVREVHLLGHDIVSAAPGR